MGVVLGSIVKSSSSQLLIFWAVGLIIGGAPLPYVVLSFKLLEFFSLTIVYPFSKLTSSATV
jgi:hypothetical protein